MFDNIREKLYLKRVNLLLKRGIYEKRIVPFDEELYEKMSRTYIDGIPIYIEIKYLKPLFPPGRCLDRSLYMFFCFKESVLVRANEKYLELKYGKEDSSNGWVEIGEYVYDPTLLLRFDKKLYYQIYNPTEISKCTKDEFCQLEENKKMYEDISQTTIYDFLPYGKKRIELISVIPKILSIAKRSNNSDFVSDINKYVDEIQYDEEEIFNELNEAFNKEMYY